MNPLCIYHGNCCDGFAAAWVVRKALGDHVEYHPAVYQNSPPPVDKRDVIIVDFSYKREVMRPLVEACASLVLLDHHKTAQADLDFLLKPVFDQDHAAKAKSVVTFDMERSGAMLAWDHYFPDDPPPQLLKHVQDRDLWRFALAGTREIQAALFSHPYDFGLYDELMDLDHHELDRGLRVEGRAIERKHHKDIAELTGVVTRTMVIGGYPVPVANLPYTLTSDAGHLLAAHDPFAACYWDTPEGRVFSLRSCDDGADVSAIAARYGGGGHAHAAGFRVPWGHELTLPTGRELTPTLIKRERDTVSGA